MKHQKIAGLLIICQSLALLAGCQVSGNQTTTTAKDSQTTQINQSQANASNTSQAGTDSEGLPHGFATGVKGTLAKTDELSPGNPKYQAPTPVAPDLKALPNKTDKGMEAAIKKFENYLKETYPEHEFKVYDVMNYQTDDKTYIRGRAQSTTSQDIAMDLLLDGDKIYDSLEKDVAGRGNTMNRWRFEFQKILDDITQPILPEEVLEMDVAYDYDAEVNLPMIKLDAPLSPMDTAYVNAGEFYLTPGEHAPDALAGAIFQVFKDLSYNNYRFDKIYFYIEDAKGDQKTYEMAYRMGNNQSFPKEFAKILKGEPSEMIKPTDNPKEQ